MLVGEASGESSLRSPREPFNDFGTELSAEMDVIVWAVPRT
ncbi:hypothetical protein P7L87_25450 [Vibrio parahaemolyticus]|nr:hypothetical protein [Vibrio parahaemolyticus]